MSELFRAAAEDDLGAPPPFDVVDAAVTRSRRWRGVAVTGVLALALAIGATIGISEIGRGTDRLSGPASSTEVGPDDAVPLTATLTARERQPVIDCVGEPAIPTLGSVPGQSCVQALGDEVWQTTGASVVRGGGPSLLLRLSPEAASQWDADVAGRDVFVLADSRRIPFDAAPPTVGADAELQVTLTSSRDADRVFRALTGALAPVVLQPLDPPVDLREVGAGGCTVADPPDPSLACDLGARIALLDEVRDASVEQDSTVGPSPYSYLSIDMAPDDADTWARWTTAHVGQQVAIVVDGQVVSAPIVQSAITGGTIQVPLRAE